MIHKLYKSLLILCTLFVPIGAQKVVNIHGFVSQGFLLSKNYNYISDHSRDGSWEMREIGLNFQKEVGNRFRVGLQLLSRDVGIYGENRIELDWAYGNVRIVNPLQISIGRNKLELGFYSTIQDFDFLTPFAIMPSVFYDKGLRSVSSAIDGIKIYGTINLGKKGNLLYNGQLGDLDIGPNSDLWIYGPTLGLMGNPEGDIGLVSCINLQYESPIEGLKLNFTLFHMKDFIIRNFQHAHLGTVTNTEQTTWLFGGIQYQHYFFDAVFEYRHVGKDINRELHDLHISQNGARAANQGGYAGLLFKPSSFLHFGGYYQLYWHETNRANLKTSKNTINSLNNINRDGALTLGFNINSDLVIKLEGHMVYGTAKVSKFMNPNNPFTDKYWQYGVAKVTYNF